MILPDGNVLVHAHNAESELGGVGNGTLVL
jgi:hypothetical protein